MATTEQRAAVSTDDPTEYEDTYRLAYIRGPEGIVVALAEQLR